MPETGFFVVRPLGVPLPSVPLPSEPLPSVPLPASLLLVGPPPLDLSPRAEADPEDLIGSLAALIVSGGAWSDATGPPTQPPLSSVTRVELGFRDGTTALLDPASEQAAALEEIAHLLYARD